MKFLMQESQKIMRENDKLTLWFFKSKLFSGEETLE